MVPALIAGFLMGFIGSMPIAGPIAVLVLNRGVKGRFASGAHIAMGAALSEAAYACLAFWGFGTLLADQPWIDPVARGIAALILLGLGVHFARQSASPVDPVTPVPEGGLWRSFLLGFSISALNPTLMATWSAFTTTLYTFEVVSFDSGQALPFSMGVALGVAGWFFILLGLLRRVRTRLRMRTLDRIVRGTGFVLIGLGILFAVRFVLAWA